MKHDSIKESDNILAANCPCSSDIKMFLQMKISENIWLLLGNLNQVAS